MKTGGDVMVLVEQQRASKEEQTTDVFGMHVHTCR